MLGVEHVGNFFGL